MEKKKDNVVTSVQWNFENFPISSDVIVQTFYPRNKNNWT